MGGRLVIRGIEIPVRLGRDDTSDATIIEAPIILEGNSVPMNRLIVEELRKLDARQRETEAAQTPAPANRRRSSPAVAVYWPSEATLLW